MPDRDSGPDPLIGSDLDDRYRLEARIGGGGMGSVYRARHLLMDHEVAVKILRPDLASDPTAVRRFAREAKGTFRFDHPNCVRVFDFGYDAATGVVYLVMEHLDGRTIGAELTIDGPMAPRRVIHIASQVSAALAHAHAIGLVHRDLKPDNIMLLLKGGDPDFAKVLDFGLAKLFEPDSSGTTIFSVSPLTQDGIVFGTPEYMSPEQATGQQLHPASDLYSLGAVMYQMLTGQLPLEGASFMATLTKQVREVPIAPATRRPELGIPPELDQLVMQCLAKRLAGRPGSADELVRALDAIGAKLVTLPSRLSPTLAACDTMELSTSQLEPQPTSELATATMTSAGYRANRRGLLWAGLLAIVVVVGVFVLVATYHGQPGSAGASRDDSRSGFESSNLEADSAVPPLDSGVPRMATRSDGGALSNPAEPVDAGPRRIQPQHQKPRDPAINEHLQAARDAQKKGNTLKQIAEADSVLRLDGSHKEAAYLLGDGLVTSGDKVRGCRYLGQARRVAKARQRFQSAGCK